MGATVKRLAVRARSVCASGRPGWVLVAALALFAPQVSGQDAERRERAEDLAAPSPRSPGRIVMRGGSTIDGPGAIRIDRVSRVLRAAVLDIKGCYETVLIDRPRLEGAVRVRFTIQLDGTVRDVTVRQTFDEGLGIGRCLVRVFRRLRFDPPSGGWVRLEMPIAFSVRRPLPPR